MVYEEDDADTKYMLLLFLTNNGGSPGGDAE